jgi:hypothetical protein
MNARKQGEHFIKERGQFTRSAVDARENKRNFKNLFKLFQSCELAGLTLSEQRAALPSDHAI